MIMLGDSNKKKMPSLIVSLIRKERDGISSDDERDESSDEEADEFKPEELDEAEALMDEFIEATSSKEKVIALVRFLEWFERSGHMDKESDEIDHNEVLPGFPKR